MMNRRGSVLIAVTWILSLLAIFTLAINRRVSQELFMGQWVRDRVISRTIAKAGVERALFEIQSDEFLTFDTLNEKWSSNPVGFKEIEMGDGLLYVSCDQFDSSKSDFDPNKEVLYGACDESGKLNLNTASELQISRLVTVVSDEDLKENEAMKIAQSIIDWRDEDDAAMPFGAEQSYYQAFPGSTLPRNRDLVTIEELRMINGVTQALYARMKPHVTVFTEGMVNFNTASSVVFQALGIPEDLATSIVEYRNGEDELPGTEDDGFFQLVEGITPALSTAGSFSSEDFAYISNLISEGYVGVHSDAFRIRSIGRFIKNSRTFDYEVQCIVDRQGQILFWRESNH